MDHQEQPFSLRQIFEQSLTEAGVSFTLEEQVLGVRDYLIDLLAAFLRQDKLFALKDDEGNPVRQLSQMLEYGDVLMKAQSFEQERSVHRYIGDLMLFCTGMFPEMLPKLGVGRGSFIDPCAQGRVSYDIAGSFDHEPYVRESDVLRTLSGKFDRYQHNFSLVRASFIGFANQGWTDGFEA